ncbi:unnamed protein product [Cylindrotheca closterium]|uniref:Uncharacterized protein n=1 Tax=Cylindrotheca closterium TaxID=2856 RepID=A0AAD2PUM3_9STRA|nr:unnamed protein product [Cylindrotheca closterium]
MAEDSIDDVIRTTNRARPSLLARPSITEGDFANVVGRPSIANAIQGSLRDINGALDELTVTPGSGSGSAGRRKKSGWRPSLKKQISNKLGIVSMDEMDGIGEDDVYDRSQRYGDDDDNSDLDLDGASLGLLQKELDGAMSEYTGSQGATSKDDSSDPSVIEGEFDNGFENYSVEDEDDYELPEANDPNNFIDVGDKPAGDGSEKNKKQGAAAPSESEPSAVRNSIPGEISIDTSPSVPTLKSAQEPLKETEKENTKNGSKPKMEEKNVSDQEYELGMQQVKYRALQEKMATSQAQSERMLTEQSEELETEKKAKSLVELQLLKLQQDYDRLSKEKEELYKVNKVQQKAILSLMSKLNTKTKRWL